MISGGTRWLSLSISMTAVTIFSLLWLAVPAAADFTVCSPGSGAGQCQNPRGLATDSETGRLYVADSGNNRIDVFESDGKFVHAFGWGVIDGSGSFQVCNEATGCKNGLAGSGVGQFKNPESIAVDNSGGPSKGAVYVGTDNLRVQKFRTKEGKVELLLTFAANGACKISSSTDDKLSIGAGGVVYLVDNSGGSFSAETFDESGTCLKAVPLAHSGGTLRGWAVDSAGNMYGSFGNEGTFKFKPDGSAYGSPYPLNVDEAARGVAVDSSDQLFVVHTERREKPASLAYIVVDRYSPSGSLVRRYGYGTIEGLTAAAAQLGGSGVFASETGDAAVKYAEEPPKGPVAAPPSLVVSGIGNTKATLEAEISPEGKATEYRFEYVDEATFQESGFAEALSSPAELIEPDAETPFRARYVTSKIGCPNPVTEASEPGKCLTPSTEYRFRVDAENADGEGNTPIEGPTFITKPPVEIGKVWATEVGLDAAVIHGEANPLGIPTTGYFEYVDDASFQESGFAAATPVPGAGGIDFGAGNVFTSRSVALGGLQPGTTYHYRFFATDPLIPEPVEGETGSFTTFATLEHEDCPQNEAFRTGPSAQLPDCRAYEMVSPLEKEGGDIEVVKTFKFLPSVLDQSSVSGGRFAYGSYRAFGDAQSAPLTSQYIAARDAKGWETHGISPPRTHITLEVGQQVEPELQALSPDLCQAWFRTTADPVLAPGGVAGFANLYRRLDDECGGVGYEALSTVEPPNVMSKLYYKLELQGTAVDGQASIFVAPDSLTPEAAPQPAECIAKGDSTCQLRLYIHTAEGLRSICTLPDGTPYDGPCQAGGPVEGEGVTSNFHGQGAISEDGSRVYFTAYSSVPGPGAIYLRVNPGKEQSAIVGGECTEAEKACTVAVSAGPANFWAASADGGRALYTEGGTLYEYDAEAGKVTPIAGKTIGAPGVSEDGRWVYLVSEEVKSGPNPQGKSAAAGKPNLYRYHEGSFALVATLPAADAKPHPKKGESSPVSVEPAKKTLRVGESGLQVVFMSSGRLTGSDNTDAVSGKADAEVFLYDAAANGGGGKLICASCNPTGARPSGADVSKQLLEASFEYWAAAQIPVMENALYGARVLSADGKRLFFVSSDALSPLDGNGRQDVYEWQAPGKGSCKEGAPDYHAANEGCVRLVSSGRSGRGATLLDASQSGDDVFFVTLASLVTQDYGLVDVYDARVGGGFAPPPPPPVECEGEACQPTTEAPGDEAAPASSTYEGPGNVQEGARVRRPCPKGKTLRHGRCVKKHKRRHRRQTRRAGR